MKEKKIETIFTVGKGTMGIDDEGNLYWNNKPVITEQRITLEKWVNVAIIVAALSTLTIAICTVLEYLYYC